MRNIKKVINRKDIEKIKEDFYVFDTETTKLEPIQKSFWCYLWLQFRKGNLLN
jgi:hypothetical protein